ncbi:MAG: hypothetical protein A2138_24245 [Deltaproteobacteria bacterium RBG_16_71_12]|nr:MAG: hypothetical protein A2138_24245 [Deltaproteobacteria bacterium RBG_16_71_12]
MAVRSAHKDQLDDMEKRMEELRRRFELYFMGSPEQKTPPTTHQAQVGGELRRMREDEVKSWKTIDRFRFSQIFARFVAMDRLWARTLKQIEDGVYKRDKFKVQQGKKKAQAPADTAVGDRPAGIDSFDNMDVDVGSFSDEGLIHSQPPTPMAQVGKAAAAARSAPAPVAGVPPPPQQRPAAPSGGAPGMSDQRIRQLYDVYMQAKKRSGEASSLTLDQLKKQIEKQVPQIKAKHKCDNVDFKVVLKDGKAMLKAVPK